MTIKAPIIPVILGSQPSGGGGGGQVDSVVAGTNVTVDATDPVNPIVNASGGGFNPATTDTWATGSPVGVTVTVGGQPVDASIYKQLSIDYANGTGMFYGVRTDVPSTKLGFSVFDIDALETENCWFINGITVAGATNVASWFYKYDPTALAEVSVADLNLGGVYLPINTSYSAATGDGQVTIEAIDEGVITLGCGALGEVKATVQTAAMNNGAPTDLAVATKKYVDDNAGGDAVLPSVFDDVGKTSSFTAVGGTWHTNILDTGKGAITITAPSSNVGQVVGFILRTGSGATLQGWDGLGPLLENDSFYIFKEFAAPVGWMQIAGNVSTNN